MEMTAPPRHAKPLLEMWPDFSEGEARRQCARGEVVCWARRGSPDGPWVELPAKAWEERDGPWVELPAFGLAGRLPDPKALRIISPELLVRYERREKQRNGEIKTFERLVAVERWYEPRFALADSAPPPGSSAWRRQLKDWLKHQYVPSLKGRVPPRPQVIAAVKAVWPDASDHMIRSLKRKYLRGKPGRRPK
jgi:hypothetical protein